MNARPQSMGWLSIVRLGLVQTSLGAIVVLMTSTLNRVMVVELALPALLPGALVALHYLVQVVRPRLGYGADVGQRRTPWIVGGMAVLAAGGVTAAIATSLMATHAAAGIALALVAFTAIGVGVGASGTSLLVLLAKQVAPDRRAAAATTVWLMMIAGFAITAGIAGKLLDPFSGMRLIAVTAGVCTIALVVTILAVIGVERGHDAGESRPAPGPRAPFREALAQVWAEPAARRFTIFVFVSMLAYSAQELVLEPFAGAVFGYTPGQSTQLSGVQHSGVLIGMLLVAFAGSGKLGARLRSIRGWMIGGCIGSAAALIGIAFGGFLAPTWPLRVWVMMLGIANGTFAVAAIGSMMSMAGSGRESREGVRMGLWGGAQAVAFGMGGLVGTGASDLARHLLSSTSAAYGSVFVCEALLFLVSARLAAGLVPRTARTRHQHAMITDGAGEAS